MAEQAVTLNVDDRGVGWLRLNRPQVHSAFDEALICDVTGRPLDAGLRRTTAERIARARASDDGRGRIAAFLENRGQRG